MKLSHLKSRWSLRIGAWTFLIFSLLISGCASESSDSPKDVVIKLFGAMERDDKGALAHVLDLPALMSIRDTDYALKLDTPRILRSPTDILEDLTGLGTTKGVWFSMKRILGDQVIEGDSAYVEVTFMSNKTNVPYYNRFGLHKKGERWLIYSFRTPVEDSLLIE